MEYINQIIHGDCLEVMQDIPDKSIDLVLTDPPYNFEVKGGAFNKNNKSTKRKYLSELVDLKCDIFNPIDIINSLKRVMKKFNAVFFCNKFLLDKYIIIARENNFIFDVHIIGKNNPPPFNNNQYLNDIEFIFIMRENGCYFNMNTDYNNYRKIIMVNCVQKNIHPAQKNKNILIKYINVLSKKGDTILDPFAGSGTTAVACYETNRKYICIEKEEKYVNIAKKRLSDKMDCYSLLDGEY